MAKNKVKLSIKQLKIYTIPVPSAAYCSVEYFFIKIFDFLIRMYVCNYIQFFYIIILRLDVQKIAFANSCMHENF